jgi:hypothetical protein
MSQIHLSYVDLLWLYFNVLKLIRLEMGNLCQANIRTWLYMSQLKLVTITDRHTKFIRNFRREP